MDLMRYLFAGMAILVHINFLIGSDQVIPFTGDVIGGFFAISGFLVYPNYLRDEKSKVYIRRRIRRIMPQYLLVVICFAFGLAGVSDYSPADYFSSRGFWDYLAANLSFLNWLHPDLPGVFQGPEFMTDAVNSSLWTMKVDWTLYLSVPVFVWLTHRFRRPQLVGAALLVIAISICYRIALNVMEGWEDREIFRILSRQFFGQAYYFFFGMVLYFMRHKVQDCLGGTFLIGLALYLVSGVDGAWLQILLHPAGFVMMVISLSLMPVKIPCMSHRRNISYEMYLVHFPVIQLCVWSGLSAMGKGITVASVFGLTIVLAWLLHHLSLRIISVIPHSSGHIQKNRDKPI